MTHEPKTKRAAALLTAVALGLLGAVAAPASPASAAPVTFDLWVKAGTTNLPGAPGVPVWGYTSAAGDAVTAPGGPVLEVNEGDVVTLKLTNQLTVATSLLLQGQELPPDLTGAAASGGTATYTFTAGHAGTYLYEAGLLPGAQYQTAMGLHGALVVHSATAGTAYGSGSEYDTEAPLVLSEIDPALNGSASPATFDMRTFNPRYTLINGHAHPDVAPITAAGGSTVLLRYVNAGIQYHSMGVLGAGQSVIALDGSPLGFARHYTAETIGPGQTADALVVAPNLPRATHSLSVYDASLLLHNSSTGGPGGMYTSIRVTGTPSTTDDLGPVTSGATYDTTTGTLRATVDDSARGNSNVTAAEFYLDDTVTAAPMGGAFGTPNAAVNVAVSLPAGQSVFYVRGQDAGGNWGPLSSVLVTGADTGGPTTLSPLLTPRVTNHDLTKPGVAVSATGDDTRSGNSAIASAEYFLDTVGGDGTGQPMTVNQAAPVASLDGTIPQLTVNGLSEGSHVVWIHSRDAQGNWGAAIDTNLVVDLTGPATSGTVVAPTPNNGTRALSSSVPAVRVSVPSMSDPVTGTVNSAIAKAEMFIDAPGANGSGVPLIASDGLFDGASEGGYADIPLATVKAMTNGPHVISVHAKDVAGNWGGFDTATLLVDKTAPLLSGLSVSPSPTSGAPQVTLSGTVTDTWSAPVAAEWFVGTDPGAGNGRPASGVTVTGTGPWTVTGNLDVRNLSEGSYTLRVRVRDQAGNWSATSTVAITVTATLYYSTTGNANPPGVAGTADDADIYLWSGSAHSRYLDVTALAPNPLPGNANVDGYSRGVDATHYYLSFSGNVTVPGIGVVQDEDVVFRNGTTWELWFDGSTHGLGGAIDVGAMTVRGGTLYFGINNNSTPPGVVGVGDNADVYRWDGASSYARIFNGSGPTVGGLPSAGLPAGTSVDGLVYTDATHLYLSFSATSTTVPGLGAVQDEDVVYYGNGAWAVYFDGTGHGLTSNALDVDAFDLP